MIRDQPEVRHIRVLAIAPTSFFADYGCHVRIRGHLAALRARGHDILLVTYPSGRNLAEIPTLRAPWPTRAPIQVGSSRLKLLLDAVLGPTALAAALRFRPHVLHAYLHEGALIGGFVGALLRRPLVFDFQGSLTGEMLDHNFLSPRSRWLGPLRQLERWINRRPAAILASSQHAARLLSEQFSISGAVPPSTSTPRCFVPEVIALPDSVDAGHFRPAARFDPAELEALRARWAIPMGCRLIVYLGLLASYQGTDLLLDAMARLAGAFSDAHLLLMGFPFEDRYRARATALGLAGRVTLTGVIPYETAPAHLALGQVAVAPKLSATEGSGKLLAYMAASLPVAAFDTPVHREYLGDLGIYAEPGNPEALATALAHLLSDPEDAATRGRALRGKVLGAYTWEETAALIESVYRRVCRLP